MLSHAAGTRKGGEHHQATFVAPDPQHPMYMDDLGSIGWTESIQYPLRRSAAEHCPDSGLVVSIGFLKLKEYLQDGAPQL